MQSVESLAVLASAILASSRHANLNILMNESSPLCKNTKIIIVILLYPPMYF